MSSKRFKKLPTNTKTLKSDVIEKLLSVVKKNCTAKFLTEQDETENI